MGVEEEPDKEELDKVEEEVEEKNNKEEEEGEAKTEENSVEAAADVVNKNNNAHLIKQIGPITIDSTPPEKPTRHRDVAESMRGSVLSRCLITFLSTSSSFLWDLSLLMSKFEDGHRFIVLTYENKWV